MNPLIMRQAGLGNQVDAVNQGNCPICGKKVGPDDLRDDLSRKEFFISGMCQVCQDEVFGS